MKTLSVIVVTKNEEAKIRQCLESVRWADEIVVVDCFSTDETTTICSQYTDRVIQREWPGYASQKNFGIDNATGEWILILDADEQVSDQLRQEIQVILSSNPEHDGYQIPFKNYLGNHWLRYGGLYPDYHLRLFKRDKARYGSKEIHETLDFKGKVGFLSGAVIHLTYDNYEDYLQKVNQYTSLEARYYCNAGYKVSWFEFVKPVGKFFKLYIFEQGFRDGLPGLVSAVYLTLYMFIRAAKIIEFRKTRFLSKMEDESN